MSTKSKLNCFFLFCSLITVPVISRLLLRLTLDKLNNKALAERCNNPNVISGELPAAVHDGNGVSRAFLNLWLVHLTMSYVFTR